MRWLKITGDDSFIMWMVANNMRIKYDMLADAVYFKMTNKKVARTRKNTDTFLVDFDAKGDVVGFEVLDVSSQQELVATLKNNVHAGIPVSIETATPAAA